MNRMRTAFAVLACSVTLAPVGLAAQVDQSLAAQVDALFAGPKAERAVHGANKQPRIR